MAIENESYSATLLTQAQAPGQQTSVAPANTTTTIITSASVPSPVTILAPVTPVSPPIAAPTTSATVATATAINPHQAAMPTMSTITQHGFHHPSAASLDPNNPLVAAMASAHGAAHPTVAPVDSGPVQAYAKLEGDEFCYYIRTLQVTLGRKASNSDNVDIPLGNTKSVSRQHARLFYNFSTQRFEMNVFGKNGAFVNEQFVEKGVTVPLENRTKIQIGEVSFSFLLPRMDLEEAHPDSAMTYINTPQQIEHSALAQRISTTMATPKLEEGQPLTPTAESFDTSQYANKDTKPPFSYASLIAQAINSTPTKKMTLNGIYNYITTHYPYYQMAQNGWQNSIRHNLSLNKAFVKVPRGDSEPGKGAFWTIDVTCESQFSNGVYKRNRRSTAKGPGIPGRRDSLLGMSPYDVDFDMSSGLTRKRTSIRKESASEIDDLAAGKRSATPLGGIIDPMALSAVTPTPSENGHDMMEMDYHHLVGGPSADSSTLHSHQTPPESRNSSDEMDDDQQQYHGQTGSITPIHATSAAQAQMIQARLAAQYQARLLGQAAPHQQILSQAHPMQTAPNKASSSHGQAQAQHQEQRTSPQPAAAEQ
ncbi:fork head domain-containing protein [Jimgerdemannia flammicorona]|uniref:Fork head domain-containing protein n=1 Tax=Jimgerdemannia flammicorona TaxID=994334 RepID=A0A433A0W6_9FUNG|nr:fork head domain-containing protein [Jimgerdemannia flammicorona]